MRVSAATAGQADQAQQFLDPGAALCLRHPGHAHRQLDVLGHGAVGQQVEVLEDHCHLAPQRVQGLAVQPGDVLAVDQYLAGAGGFQAIEQAQQNQAFRCLRWAVPA